MGLPIIPTGMCIFWSEAEEPGSGWTQITGKDGTFPLINSALTPGSTGGGTTHTHLITGTLLTSSAGARNSGDGNSNSITLQHTHAVSGASIGSYGRPNTANFKIYQKNASTSESSLPVGAITMYDSSTPPTGWVAFSPTGYAYITDSGLGSAWQYTHSHSFSFLSGYNSSPMGESDSGAACPKKAHRHYVTGTTDVESDAPWELDRISVRFIKKTGTTRFSQTPHYLYFLYYATDTPGGSWSELTSYDGRYIRLGSGDISTSAGSDAAHTHTVSSGQSGTDVDNWGNNGYLAQCLDHHTHSWSLSAGSGTHQNPSYTTFRLFRIEVTSFSDIGIRYRNNGVTYKIGAEDLLSTHKVRISYGGTTYGIPLLATSDPDASPIYIYDGAAVKALAKID